MKLFKKTLTKMHFGLLILTLLLIGLPSQAFASGNPWYDKYVSYEPGMRSNWYTSNQSDQLAWGESYLLRSYVDMYNLTSSTSWLDLFTSHVDTMIANADDIDNDGYLGWETYVYSPKELNNYTFETPNASDSTLPDGWTRYQSSSSTAFRSAAAAYGFNSSYGTEIHTNGTSWQQLYQNMITYEPNTKYNVRFDGKTNATPGTQGWVYVYDETAQQYLAQIMFNTTTFTHYDINFTTPAAGHTIKVYLGHTDYSINNAKAYFDNVIVSAWLPYHVHDGMVGIAMAEFSRLVNNTPALQTAYQTKSNTYRDFIANNLIPRWESSSYLGNCLVYPNGTEAYYVHPPNVAINYHGSEGTIMPYNYSLSMTRLLNIMYDVTGTVSYRDKANKLNTYFKNHLIANGTAYKWKYIETGSKIEDIEHGSIDLGAALESFRTGQLFTGTEMEKFTDTFTQYVWNQSTSNPLFRHEVDGTGDTSFSQYMMNWVDLSQFDISIWPQIAKFYSTFTPSHSSHLLSLSQLMRWDPEKVVNQGFELKASLDATQPARWVRDGSTTPANAYLDAANKSKGSYGLTIKANGTSIMRMRQTWTDWSPSTSYTVTFNGNTDGTAAGGRVTIFDVTAGTNVAQYDFTNTSWQSHTFTFTSPSVATHTVRVYLENKVYTVTNGKAYFDNFVIKTTGDSF